MTTIFAVVDPHTVTERTERWDGDPTGQVFTGRVTDPTCLVPVMREPDVHAVVVMAHRRHRQLTAHAATVAQGISPRVPVITIHHDRTALAAAAAAVITGRLRASPAQVALLLPAVMQSQYDAVLLRSVSRLHHPGVRIRHHLKSWWPGHAPFVARFGDDPRVDEVDRAAVPKAARAQLLVTEGPLAERASQFAPGAVLVPPLLHPKATYSTVASEFTVIGRIPSEPPVTGICPACHTPLPSRFCPQCRVRLIEKETVA